ncbi:uncharacterized protein NEMAJ01_0106 [Nematocida major]|uniref:uncharacterized protein n=1 Tax=Nematocida major TaxID=1912982 RepID=UPI00200786F7|nr:uncharacterized protein NEMAJ01_0106 [Nematocida major]KAH9385210.1 hypothetical protein NEMAJ01_0106 [Nematocida major]
MGILISKCINRKQRSVVFIGTPGSGKKDIIKILRKDKKDTPASEMYEQFTVRGGGYSTEVYDVSDEQKHINFWKFYTENCHLVVFVVNICTEANIMQAKEAFENFFTSYGMNKESIVFLLKTEPLPKESELSEESRRAADEEAQRKTAAFVQAFASISGLDKKALSRNLLVSEATKRSQIVSFVCKNFMQ